MIEAVKVRFGSGKPGCRPLYSAIPIDPPLRCTGLVNVEGAYGGETIAEELPGEAIYIEADVLEPTEVERLIESVGEEYDQIDVLVNNTGR